MKTPRRLRDLGCSVGKLPPGPTNTIVDVPGVRVGHCDIRGEPASGSGMPVNTGVTVIVPGQGNLFQHPLPAAVDVFNGYGKSAGTLQIQELGQLETPIALCSTLNVGRTWDALLSLVLEQNSQAKSVSPAVFECNDGMLNDIRGRQVREEHVRQAYTAASAALPLLGSHEAGSGLRVFNRKGGFGSASRRVPTASLGEVCVGVASLNNFGGPLRWQGRLLDGQAACPGGSVIVVVALNAPVGPNLLRRLARRAFGGLGRMGAGFSHSSGDIAVSFALPDPSGACPERLAWTLPQPDLNLLFDAVMDATEESVWDCMLAAEDTHAPGCSALALRAEDLLEK